MSPLDEARDALAEGEERLSIRKVVGDGRGITGRDLAALEHVVAALRALIEPPTVNERPDFVMPIYEDDGPTSTCCDVPGGPERCGDCPLDRRIAARELREVGREMEEPTVAAAPQCSCSCHTMPGVKHIAACCSQPLIASTPPTDDDEREAERESLIQGLIRAVPAHINGEGLRIDVTDLEGILRRAFDQGAGFYHRQGPVTNERHAGYLQLHNLVRDAPEGVREAVGDAPQRILANGSFSLAPEMLLHLLTAAYRQGRQRPVAEAEVDAADEAYLLSMRSDALPWSAMRAALEAARGV